MGNLIATVFLWVWSNFIGWPTRESRLTGFVRFALYFYLNYHSKVVVSWVGGGTWGLILDMFLILQLFIGMFQFVGLYSLNGPFDFKLSRQIRDGINDGSIKVVGNNDYSFDRQYPGLSKWFRVRDHHMSMLPNSEKAKFFVETGALTEESVKDLMKYPHTRRAIQRLDYECQKPAAELINFMRGKKI